MDIGFIGLGLMGRPMALHLAKAGHRLHLWARRPASLAPFKDTEARAHISAAAVARHAEVVFTMVADAPDVREVCLGEDRSPSPYRTYANQPCTTSCPRRRSCAAQASAPPLALASHTRA